MSNMLLLLLTADQLISTLQVVESCSGLNGKIHHDSYEMLFSVTGVRIYFNLQ